MVTEGARKKGNDLTSTPLRKMFVEKHGKWTESILSSDEIKKITKWM
jgi:hypothetical protein